MAPPTTSFPALFERMAVDILGRQQGLLHHWERSGETVRLVFPRQCERGFEIVADATPYGLYASSGKWHSAAWEPLSTVYTPEEVVVDFLGFLRTLLSADARLEIHHAGRKPYKWVMHYRVEGGWERDTTGALFFNYFGRRATTSLQNTVLPPRY